MRAVGAKKYTIHCYLVYGFAFFLPLLPRMATLMALLLLLNWGLSGWIVKYRKKLFNPVSILFIGFFLWLLLGLSYTEQLDVGLRKMETKMSLLLGPLIFFSSPKLERNKLYKALAAFVLGCLLASLISLACAAYYWIFEGANLFFYEDLGRFLAFHPTYFGLYINLCLFILAYFYYNQIDLKLPIAFNLRNVVPLASIFFVMLFLLSARMQLLNTIVLLGGAFLVVMYQRRQLLKGIFWGSGGLIAILLLILAIPVTRNRVMASVTSNAEQETEKESPSPGAGNLRLGIWRGAIENIKARPLLGYGPGDTQVELNSYYQSENIEIALKRKLNAHNQYLQIALSNGIPALLGLLLVLFIPFYRSVSAPLYLHTFFILLLVFSFLTESMLEVQRGTLLLGAFHSMFTAQYLE